MSLARARARTVCKSTSSAHRLTVCLRRPHSVNVRLVRIAELSVPIVAGALATNLMSFIDTLMVGQLGNAALGGVGIGGQLFFLLLGILLGLAAGVQATVARRVGEGQLQSTGKVLNAGILIAATVGVVVMALGYLLMPPLYAFINRDPLIVQKGLTYLS